MYGDIEYRGDGARGKHSQQMIYSTVQAAGTHVPTLQPTGRASSLALLGVCKSYCGSMNSGGHNSKVVTWPRPQAMDWRPPHRLPSAAYNRDLVMIPLKEKNKHLIYTAI